MYDQFVRIPLQVMLIFCQMSPSDQEDENDPDGIYAFKRKKNCSYYAVGFETKKKSDFK